MFLKSNSQRFSRPNATALAVFLLVLFSVATIRIVDAAWKSPTNAPPNDNIPAPLNINTVFTGDVSGKYETGLSAVNLKLQIAGCTTTGQSLVWGTAGFECSDVGGDMDLLQVLSNGSDASQHEAGVFIGNVSSSKGFLDVGGPLTSNWLHAVSETGLSTIGHNLELGGKLAIGTVNDNSSIKIQNTGNSAVYGIDARRNVNGKMEAGATGGRQTLTDVNAGTGNIVNQIRNFDWIRVNSGLINSIYGNRTQIDVLGGSVTSSYLFYGTYSGSGIINKYGIYLNGETKNYFSGKLGIGTTAPNSSLHVASNSGNAEIDIQSISGTGNHWAIYNDSNSNSLLFWRKNNVLELKGGDSEVATAVEVKGQLCLGGVCKGAWPSGGLYVGKTVTAYNGNQVNYATVNQYCNSAFSGSHVCSNEEMLNSAKVSGILPVDGGAVWVNAGGSSSSNDCRGWQSSDASNRGVYWFLNNISSVGYTVNCNISLPFACCK